MGAVGRATVGGVGAVEGAGGKAPRAFSKTRAACVGAVVGRVNVAPFAAGVGAPVRGFLEVEAAGLGFGRSAVGGRANAIVRGVGAVVDEGAGVKAPRAFGTRVWGAVGRANSVVGAGAVVDEGADRKTGFSKTAARLGALRRVGSAVFTAGVVGSAPRAVLSGTWPSGILTPEKGIA